MRSLSPTPWPLGCTSSQGKLLYWNWMPSLQQNIKQNSKTPQLRELLNLKLKITDSSSTETLFGGKANSLAKTVDKFLNQNTDKFIKDFQPAIAKSVSGFMKGFYNSAVANIELDAFE